MKIYIVVRVEYSHNGSDHTCVKAFPNQSDALTFASACNRWVSEIQDVYKSLEEVKCQFVGPYDQHVVIPKPQIDIRYYFEECEVADGPNG